MAYGKIKYSLLSILFLAVFVLGGMIFFSQNGDGKVVFLNVGQGDAILIKQNSKQILIDGGPSEQVLLEKLGRQLPFWDRKIELVIATHPDQDHIQGLMGVLKSYQVNNIMETKVESESQLYKKYQELIEEKKIARINGEFGTLIKTGEFQLEIMAPKKSVPVGLVKDTNQYSIVSKLVFGESSFLLTGDLPSDEEEELIREKANLKSQFLKVGHHGSKYSTAESFLEEVSPQKAIISVGKNNRFGHPAPEILERLEKKSIEILRTDEAGDIEFICGEEKRRCERKN